jgi:hypothetical protein
MKLESKQGNERLNEIYKITSILLNDDNDENTLKHVLELACSMLNLDTGIVCSIKDNEYQILEIFQDGDDTFDKNTYAHLLTTGFFPVSDKLELEGL